MGKMEFAKAIGVSKKYWLVDQWRLRGEFGKVERDRAGKYIYTAAHVAIAKKILAKGKKH